MSLDDHTGAWAPRENKAQASERRMFRLVMLATLPLFAALWLVFPNIGPIFRSFNHPSASMAPTIPEKSFSLASRWSYGLSRSTFDWFDLPINGRWPAGKPARGDIVVFRKPNDAKTFYIKRVIGLPGERVKLDKGRLVINGTTVEREVTKKKAHDPFDKKKEVDTYVEKLPDSEPYTIIETAGDRGGLDDTAEVKVPDGHYFMLGDNRDNSNDSRVAAETEGLGFVPFDHFLGRVIFTMPNVEEELE